MSHRCDVIRTVSRSLSQPNRNYLARARQQVALFLTAVCLVSSATPNVLGELLVVNLENRYTDYQKNVEQISQEFGSTHCG